LPIKYISKGCSKDCAVLVLNMVLNYYKTNFNKDKFYKKFKLYKEGYNLTDIARFLIQKNFKLEYGFWDEDYLKKNSFKKIPITLKELEKYYKEGDYNKDYKIDLEHNLNFYKKFPHITKIEPISLKKIDAFLLKKTPVHIHVDLKHYWGRGPSHIHSVLVTGKRKNKYIVLNPGIGRQIKSGKVLLESWKRGGGYYLAIKKAA